MVRGRAWKVLVAGALVAGAVVVGVGPAPAVQASNITYVVNSTLDEPHDPAFPGQCRSTPSGVCTLRAALEAGPPAPVSSSDVVTVALTNVLGQTISLDGPITFGDLGRLRHHLGHARPQPAGLGGPGLVRSPPGLRRRRHPQPHRPVAARTAGSRPAQAAPCSSSDAQRCSSGTPSSSTTSPPWSGGAAAITTQQLLISDSTFVEQHRRPATVALSTSPRWAPTAPP